MITTKEIVDGYIQELYASSPEVYNHMMAEKDDEWRFFWDDEEIEDGR